MEIGTNVVTNRRMFRRTVRASAATAAPVVGVVRSVSAAAITASADVVVLDVRIVDAAAAATATAAPIITHSARV